MYPWDGKNIYFIGFMATGKSRVGKSLARMLGWPFADTDSLIEKKTGMSVQEIFAQKGEPYFREMEDHIIREIAQKKHCVFSLGGGAVAKEQNWKLLETSGITICLYADEDVLYQRLIRKNHRPLLKDLSPEAMKKRIDDLLAQRRPYYERANYRFQSFEEIRAEDLAAKIFEFLRDEV